MPIATAAPDPICQADEIRQVDIDGWDRGAADETSVTLARLFACLASPDPALRDRLAYEGLVALMRSEKLGADDLQGLFTRSLETIAAPDSTDPEGVYRPFAALILAEAIRADRISAYLSPEDRATALETVDDYLGSLADYRGFDPDIGWRHGVAHAADVLLQMVLNPAFDVEDHERILAVVASKVAPAQHAYVFGEPRRLARPVLYIALAGTIEDAAWEAWFAGLVTPDPLESWNDTWSDASGLRRLHNLRAFLTTLYVSADSSGTKDLEGLRDHALSALSQLP